MLLLSSLIVPLFTCATPKGMPTHMCIHAHTYILCALHSPARVQTEIRDSTYTVVMPSTFDLCLLLYVIRLAGWLKHCYLSRVDPPRVFFCSCSAQNSQFFAVSFETQNSVTTVS